MVSETLSCLKLPFDYSMKLSLASSLRVARNRELSIYERLISACFLFLLAKFSIKTFSFFQEILQLIHSKVRINKLINS